VKRQGKALGDAWVLGVDSGRWRKIRLNCACYGLDYRSHMLREYVTL